MSSAVTREWVNKYRQLDMSKAPGIKDILRDVDERLGTETLDSIVTQPIVKPIEPLFTAPTTTDTPPPQQPVYSLF